MLKDEEMEMYEEDELKEIEKLEKLDERKLMARLVYELNRFNVQYENSHIPEMQKIRLYFDEMEKVNDEDFLLFDEWNNRRENIIMLNNNEEYKKREELRNKINKNWTRMCDDVDKFNKKAHDQALEEAIKQIKKEFDWDNLPSKSQIRIKLRSLGIQIKYKDRIHGDDLVEYKSIDDCPTKTRPLPLTELEVCFYKAQKHF